MPTMRDIAKQVGVCRYTVSKVLNGDSSVRKDVREHVLAACQALGYVPNPHAVSLVRGHSRAIGMLVSRITDSFYGEVIEAAEKEAKAQDFQLTFACTYNQPDLERDLLQHFHSQRVVGVIA